MRLCINCKRNKATRCFGTFSPTRPRTICNGCRSAKQQRIDTERTRRDFQRVTGWPVP